ncbi:hypothetical protein [Serratia proteamaculans]|uniref:hypothetical protein n=1 Tax=Serratia proteamaculans TaxID=28151 RepID=UPI00142EC991|nr:hypothetical protein [Serratia proteamaculans]
MADVTGIAQAATEESNPQASAALGWVSLALGVVAMGVGAAGIYSSKLAMRLSKQSIRELPTNGNVVTLGGQMENPHMITPQLMTFTEKMKRSGDVRLTILAHGERINGASAIPLGGEIYDAEKLHELVKVIYPDFSYDKVRFLSCFSAEGGSNSLAANYAKIVKKPAKGFVGTVSANLTPEKIVSIMDDLNFGSEVVMRRVKYNAVTVYKKNPYSFFTQNSASRNFSFSPLKFNSEGELWSDVI